MLANILIGFEYLLDLNTKQNWYREQIWTELVSRTNMDRLSTERDALVMVLNQTIYFIIFMLEGQISVLLLCTRKGGGYCHLFHLKMELEDKQSSLATTLTSSKTKFSNELTYMPNIAPRSSSLVRLEAGDMQVSNLFTRNYIITISCFVVLILLSSTFNVFPKEDKESLELCRTMQQRG
jgi:hypothetical protein